MIRLIAITFAFAVSACTRPPDPVPLQLPPLDTGLSTPCARPVAIPTGAVAPSTAATLWTRDRAALADCADRQAALVQTYDLTRAALGGAP